MFFSIIINRSSMCKYGIRFKVWLEYLLRKLNLDSEI